MRGTVRSQRFPWGYFSHNRDMIICRARGIQKTRHWRTGIVGKVWIIRIGTQYFWFLSILLIQRAKEASQSTYEEKNCHSFYPLYRWETEKHREIQGISYLAPAYLFVFIFSTLMSPSAAVMPPFLPFPNYTKFLSQLRCRRRRYTDSNLQVRKLQLRKLTWLAQAHMVGRGKVGTD